MRILRSMSDKTRKDRIRNKCICRMLGVAPIADKLRESQLRWFSHVHQRPMTTSVRGSDLVHAEGIRRIRGRQKMTCVKVVRKDMSAYD